LNSGGRRKKLSTLHEASQVLNSSSVENAKILLDPFHMYVGGSEFSGLQGLRGEQIGVFHVNDYPQSPAREKIEDKDRVFPGEGVSPADKISSTLYDIGYRGYLSLELFISDFQGRDALEVSKYGLQVMKEAYKVHK